MPSFVAVEERLHVQLVDDGVLVPERIVARTTIAGGRVLTGEAVRGHRAPGAALDEDVRRAAPGIERT
jgi:hypothetical protein